MPQPEPKYVTLSESVMKWYILNVIGSDQIHDFCDTSRIAKITSEKTKTLIAESGQSGGAQYCINIPEKDEYIGMQCLECFNVFLDTIMEGGYIYNKINTSQIADAVEDTLNPNDYYIKLNTQIITRCQSFNDYIKRGEYICEFNNICLNNILEIYDAFINEISKINSIHTPFNLFYNKSNEYFEKKYSTDTDGDNADSAAVASTSASDAVVEQDNNHQEMDIASIPPASKRQRNDYPYINIFKFLTRGGITGGARESQYSKFSNKLKLFLCQMAFTFCDISNNTLEQTDKHTFENWKNGTGDIIVNNLPPNLFIIEELILRYSINTIESVSTKYVTELLKRNNLNKIKKLSGINKNNKLDCNYIPKHVGEDKKIIISNAASIPDNWKENYICNTYPGFIDSQPSNNNFDALNETGTYKMGFKDNISDNHYYYLNLDGSANHEEQSNTIEIKYGKKRITTEKSASDFKKPTWKKVDAATALSAAFDNLFITPTREHKLNWDKLMEGAIKDKNAEGTIKSFYEYSLFKGLGDISQEMTALIKNGGLITEDTNPKSRFFLANDRLSANRFILTLNDGLNIQENNINKNCYGGYFHQFGCSTNSFYLVEPKPIPPTGGGTKNKRKSKKSKKTRKTKNKKQKTRKTKK